MLGALAWLLLFNFIGEVTVGSLRLPLPGAVVGLMLLFTVLVIRGSVPDNLRATSATLLQYLMLLLVPATTGLMLHFQRLGREWLPIMLAGFVGTAVTMAVTAVTFRLLVARSNARTQ